MVVCREMLRAEAERGKSREVARCGVRYPPTRLLCHVQYWHSVWWGVCPRGTDPACMVRCRMRGIGVAYGAMPCARYWSSVWCYDVCVVLIQRMVLPGSCYSLSWYASGRPP
eukprot:505515-Rhodomonas_salina.1